MQIHPCNSRNLKPVPGLPGKPELTMEKYVNSFAVPKTAAPEGPSVGSSRNTGGQDVYGKKGASAVRLAIVLPVLILVLWG
jgi:hypothetical protein